MAQEEEKMLVDTLRPTAQMKTAVVDVKAEERVNILDELATMIKEEGVEYNFSLVGGNGTNVDFFLQKAGIKRVQVRHEQSAGFAMDAWGRLTRRPGFCAIGPGTGLTNFTTGVVQAYAAGAPGVGFVAESGTMDDDKYGGQGIARSEAQFAGITKWVRRVTYPSNLLWQVKRAFRAAVTPPTGPVVVAITTEMSGPGLFMPRRAAYSTYTPGFWKPHTWKTQGDPELIKKAVQWLMEAERPVLIAGHQAHQDDCQNEMREFIHLIGLPAHSRRIARGLVSEEDPLNYGRRARGIAMDQADRCLVVGLRIGSLEGFGQAPFFPHHVRYCQLQSDVQTVDLCLPTDIEIIGNLKEILKQMIQCCKDMGIKKPVEKWEKWRQFLLDTAESYRKRTMSRTERMTNRTPLHPDLVGRYSAEILSQDYNNNYIAIIDGYTASSYFTNWNVAVNTGTVLDASETIGIGHSPGMALAAGLATNREKPILGLMGDGAVGAGGMDIETCCRWNIPVVFLHENNNTLINGSWENFNAGLCAVEGNILHDSWQVTHDTHYERIFAEFGAHPEFVERPDQVIPALKRSFQFAMKEKMPAFIECFVDMDVVHSNMAQQRGLQNRATIVRWNELPEKGRKLIATQLIQPQTIPTLPKDWQEGIASFQKK